MAEAEAMTANPRAWIAETPLVQALTDAASPYIARHRQPKRHLSALPLDRAPPAPGPLTRRPPRPPRAGPNPLTPDRHTPMTFTKVRAARYALIAAAIITSGVGTKALLVDDSLTVAILAFWATA
ncbi:hypothetical protein AB0B45_49750 [Nonomuraea sp. NPDC049152]|uniref:hypothetical protein n=1 Tax=Nonomuraea sp. NPDC049152 TaxID=3154350 RepID=UPI003400E21A